MSDLRQLAESIIGAADFNNPDDALCDAQKAARDIAKECRRTISLLCLTR